MFIIIQVVSEANYIFFSQSNLSNARIASCLYFSLRGVARGALTQCSLEMN